MAFLAAIGAVISGFASAVGPTVTLATSLASAGMGIAQATKKTKTPDMQKMPEAPTLEDATDKAAKAQDARRRMLGMAGGNTDITQGAGILTNVQRRTLLA